MAAFGRDDLQAVRDMDYTGDELTDTQWFVIQSDALMIADMLLEAEPLDSTDNETIGVGSSGLQYQNSLPGTEVLPHGVELSPQPLSRKGTFVVRKATDPTSSVNEEASKSEVGQGPKRALQMFRPTRNHSTDLAQPRSSLLPPMPRRHNSVSPSRKDAPALQPPKTKNAFVSKLKKSSSFTAIKRTAAAAFFKNDK